MRKYFWGCYVNEKGNKQKWRKILEKRGAKGQGKEKTRKQEEAEEKANEKDKEEKHNLIKKRIYKLFYMQEKREKKKTLPGTARCDTLTCLDSNDSSQLESGKLPNSISASNACSPVLMYLAIFFWKKEPQRKIK